MKLNQGDTILLSQMRYNELGEMEQKNLHSEDMVSVLQSVDYTYNIRGWLTGINEPGNLNRNKALFGMKLSYDDPDGGIGADAQYNGNISAQEWKHDDETFIKGYGYRYDNLNRLLSADYKEKPSTTWQQQSRFDVSKISYDLNGNIDTLYRYGDQGTLMDQLTYFYHNAGNRLDSVADAASTTGFYDGNTSGSDYLYDGNGNMKEDKNKDITISYNYLNLPEVISGEENIYYIYDASGVKWVKDYADQTYTAYYGSFVYKSSSPQSGYAVSYILNPEGMINKDGATMEYQYFLKDHLGNTRVVFSDSNHDGWIDRGVSSTEVLQRTDYYPFGMSFAGMQGGENKYLYNGKEMQDESLGGVNLDLYDYGARYYDAQIGRFATVDPMAEYYLKWSPYSFCYNNPVRYIDPYGLGIIDWIKRKSDEAKIRRNEKAEMRGSIPEVTIVGNHKSKDEQGSTQPSGLHLASNNIGFGPGIASEDPDVQTLYIDDLLTALGRALAGRFSKSSLDAAKGLKRVTDIFKKISGNETSATSDEHIIKENTDNPEVSGPEKKTIVILFTESQIENTPPGWMQQDYEGKPTLSNEDTAVFGYEYYSGGKFDSIVTQKSTKTTVRYEK